MIVERRTYIAQYGREHDMVEIIKAEQKAFGPGMVTRILRSNVAPLFRVVHEIEFPDLAAREAFWEKWLAERATPEFWEKWGQVITPGGDIEIWNLEE